VSSERVESSPATTKRALGYLRWYPSAWRERYGEEFVAHLEIELTQRPVSIARTTDIVAHGLLERLSFQRGLRIALGATAVVTVVVTVLAALSLSQHFAPVTITSGDNGGLTGVGQFSTPSQVNDVAFNFSTHSRLSIRITSVKVIPLRGYLAPIIVGAEFAPHASELINDHGWPIRLPKGTTVQAEGRVPLVQALGTTVTLARTDALWLGLRTPLLRHTYAVEQVKVTYERRGVSHSMIIDQSTSPDVICSSSSRSVNIPSWCAQEILAANLIANFSKARQSPPAEAQLIAQLALSEVQASGHGVPSIAEVRRWAARFFPANGEDAIRSVTEVVRAGIPEWRFVIREASSGSTVVLCTNRGLVDSGGGMIGIGAESCPSPTQG
jgi:hypothetical protein